jgi:hypothetical protein
MFRDSPGSMGFKGPCPSVCSVLRMSYRYSKPKYTTFLIMRTHILTFPRWDEISISVEQPSASHWQQEQEGEEDVWIGDCRVWTEPAKGERRICKVNDHIRHLSSKLNTSYCMISSLKHVTSPYVLRTMYFACFHVHLRYVLTLWGGDPESIRIFWLQKKVLRLIVRMGRRASFMNLFKNLNILPLPCLYISEVACCIKSNMDKMKYNGEIHDHCTCQKLDLPTQFCRTTLLKNSGANVGIKLYNKLPNTIKWLDKIQEFKRRLKYFLLQHTFYSVDEYMSS